jgi:hypothetical protein
MTSTTIKWKGEAGRGGVDNRLLLAFDVLIYAQAKMRG